jgi:hypothetical protein
MPFCTAPEPQPVTSYCTSARVKDERGRGSKSAWQQDQLRLDTRVAGLTESKQLSRISAPSSPCQKPQALKKTASKAGKGPTGCPHLC